MCDTVSNLGANKNINNVKLNDQILHHYEEIVHFLMFNL